MPTCGAAAAYPKPRPSAPDFIPRNPLYSLQTGLCLPLQFPPLRRAQTLRVETIAVMQSQQFVQGAPKLSRCRPLGCPFQPIREAARSAAALRHVPPATMPPRRNPNPNPATQNPLTCSPVRPASASGSGRRFVSNRNKSTGTSAQSRYCRTCPGPTGIARTRTMPATTYPP